uniref:ADP-ribosyl-[dinitrogen reductase] hydrolase n=1 Tax=Candidatus Kentrum sp. FW TaxID=2126338 RepID=A0A450T517_9GAMM|nr:MAG: ADP-ribosyl-[dinitrogen reductase] hydrolase [Candidatus Kentron sp. FW]
MPVAMGNAGSSPVLTNRAIGAYLGLAVGDALGATTEFLTPREIREKYGIHKTIRGGGWLRLKAGQVTDDTGMSLALGQSILTSRGVDAMSVAHAFSEWMRTKPVDIGNTVRRGIVHFWMTGIPEVPVSEFSAGNGACMRSLPIALYGWNASTKALIESSRIQSHVTHNAPVADAGTKTIVRMVVLALRGEDKESLQQCARNLVQDHEIYRHDRKRVENPSAWIVETLQAVFQAFFSHGNFEDALVDVVNRGGDSGYDRRHRGDAIRRILWPRCHPHPVDETFG